MKRENVFFIPLTDPADDESATEKLRGLIGKKGLLDFIDDHDTVAIKTHFGEHAGSGFVRPCYFKMLGSLVRDKKGQPFLTETQTLYRGNRTNAISHINHAYAQGFGYENTNLPIIMADGLFGDEDVDVAINGKIYKSVKIASQISKAQGMLLVSHFTGHIAAGFGSALKNLGMGCSSRRGKMVQHSKAKPKIKQKACTKCGVCEKWCPTNAISINFRSAEINETACIGCGQCLALCRFDAVAFTWSTANEDLQNMIAEHALGVTEGKKGKLLCINVLTRISKDCDCMTGFEKVSPDIGIIVSKDPLACDAASLDMAEQKIGKKLSEIAYNIPYRSQIDYAHELGLGNKEYDLVIFD
jgi:hypothetical protein